jgi:hypothetical protein
MIECIFTIDYEIYGNGTGSLKELIYVPTERLMEIFRKWNARFVSFIEVAELEMMEVHGTDKDIDIVKHQIRELHQQGFELGLHLHPQWYNARYDNGKWQLDYSEYNLCVLSQERIAQIIERSINYFRDIVEKSDFTPLSFRAGNWLFQPSKIVARILSEHGIKVDSSVFKGGIHHQYELDYRRAILNGYYWTFTEHVDIPDPNGVLLELPIYTQLVPFWKMITVKNIGMQKKSFSSVQNSKKEIYHLLDFLRFWQPLKLDFCRMTINQLINMVDKLIKEDQKTPTSFKPLVAIGHTKDLVDVEIIECFLTYLERKRIAVSTFKDIYHRCKN